MTFLSMGSIAGVGYDCSPELSVIAEEVQRVLLGERPDSILIANYAQSSPHSGLAGAYAVASAGGETAAGQ